MNDADDARQREYYAERLAAENAARSRYACDQCGKPLPESLGVIDLFEDERAYWWVMQPVLYRSRVTGGIAMPCAVCNPYGRMPPEYERMSDAEVDAWLREEAPDGA